MEITVFAGKYGEAPALKKEHALGLFISTAEHNCMFDFGDKTAAGNLAALEIAPETADAAILSHGHLGAGGGCLPSGPDWSAQNSMRGSPRLRRIISKIALELQDGVGAEKGVAGRGFVYEKLFEDRRRTRFALQFQAR
ncbi:MAG: hypothetical protein ACLR06_03115 [Christensenellaceae bacterium]